MGRKPSVWYVDDLTDNLEAFKARHGRVFKVCVFSKPEDVLEALTTATPDALLCDIFFYSDPQESVRIEKYVEQQAEELRQVGNRIGADAARHQAGIPLIQCIRRRFGDKFPVYAYTSKGPYLLDRAGYEQIAASGAKWLFKQLAAVTERCILQQDIDEYRMRNSIGVRLVRYFWGAVFTSGILGGFVVWALTEAAPRLLQHRSVWSQ